MTKKLDPEIKGLRAIERAMSRLGAVTQNRVAKYVRNRWATEAEAEAEGHKVKTYTDPAVTLRFEPRRSGISRAYINILAGRTVWCGLKARNIQRALALPDDSDEWFEVELVLRRRV